MVKAVVIRVDAEKRIHEGKYSITVEEFAEPFEETVRSIFDGGYPEFVWNMRAPVAKGFKVVVDSDGLPKKLPPNDLATLFSYSRLFGTVVFVHANVCESEEGTMLDYSSAPDTEYENVRIFLQGLIDDIIENHKSKDDDVTGPPQGRRI